MRKIIIGITLVSLLGCDPLGPSDLDEWAKVGDSSFTTQVDCYSLGQKIYSGKAQGGIRYNSTNSVEFIEERTYTRIRLLCDGLVISN